MSTEKIEKMDIRNIKDELKRGYISSRYFYVPQISKNCFCRISFNTYKKLVEIRVFDEKLLVEAFCYYEKKNFLKMKKKDIIKDVENVEMK